jgi:hypothetical protein
MAEEIVLKVDVELEEGARSLKSLKQEFRETQKDLEGLTVGSQKYVDTLKKLGAVKDEIGDLNATINAFNPEGKVQALGNAIGGVASGFQAAVGATALFGSESEELNKSLLKVQATMAFVEGIKGVIAMGDSFAVLNAIIAANPIMAVVTGVTLLTGAVYGLISAQDEEIKQLKELNKEQEKLRDVTRERELDLAKFRKDLQTNRLEQQLNVAKASGASEEELYQLEKKLLNQRQADLLFTKESRGKLSKEEALQLIAFQNQEQLLDAAHKKTLYDNAVKAAEDKKKLNEEIAKGEAELQAELETSFAESETKKIIDEDKRRADNLAKDIQANDEYLANEKKNKQDEDTAKKQLHDDNLKRVLEAQQVERDGLTSIQAVSEIAMIIKRNNVKKGSEEEQKILKRQFDINKGFQIANAAMSGLQAIQLIMASTPDPTGITIAFRIAATAATTAANIAKIASTKFNAGSTSAAPTATAPPTTGGGQQSTNAPVVNAPASNPTTLNPDGSVRQQSTMQSMVKAVVVETDITQAQKKVSNIKDLATFG